jgi:peroxiredoxin
MSSNSTVQYPHKRSTGRSTTGRRRSKNLFWALGAALLVAALLGGSFLIGGKKTSSNAVNAAAASVGSTAPAFAGRDVISGQEISAKQLAGKNVLYFFNEGVMCQACMVQIQSLQQHLAHLKREHLNLVSITNDDPSTLAQAASGYKISTPLVADQDKTLTERFGALGGGMHSDTADHTFILVDRSGTVRFHKDFPTMWVDPNKLLKQLPKVA